MRWVGAGWSWSAIPWAATMPWASRPGIRSACGGYAWWTAGPRSPRSASRPCTAGGIVAPGSTRRWRRPLDGWALLPRIQAPTLLVRGGLSPVMPAEMADRMVTSIPNAKLVTIPGAYHHLVLDAPEAFTRLLDDFLRGLPD